VTNETYARRINQTSLSIVQTRIESVREKDITKTGFRVFDGEHIGTSGAIGVYDPDELRTSAQSALTSGIRYSFPPSGPRKQLVDRSVSIVSGGELVSEFDELLSELRTRQPDFIFSNKINLTKLDISMKNDIGLDLGYKDASLNVSLLFKEKASANIMDGFVAYESRRYDRQVLLDYVDAVCRAFQNTVPLPEGTKHPVIFATQQPLPLRKLAEDLNGNRFGSKTSLLSDRAEQQVFSEAFTLFQTRNPDDIIAPFFDAEGVVNKEYRFTLIDRGVVVAPFTDKRVADKYGLKPTGSATAEYDGVPSLGTPEFRTQESDETVASLLRGRKALFVFVAFGGDFTPDGTFGTPVQLAFLFDGKELLGRLPEFNLSSNVFNMFGRDFVGVGNDPYFGLSDDRCLIMEMEVSRL
jgi:PmbA protein